MIGKKIIKNLLIKIYSKKFVQQSYNICFYSKTSKIWSTLYVFIKSMVAEMQKSVMVY